MAVPIPINLDAGDGLVVIHVLIEALSVLTIDLARTDPDDPIVEIQRGQILLADEILQRVWPLVAESRVGESAGEFRRSIASVAHSIRLLYGLDDQQ